MFTYYTSILVIVWIALLILSILVFENDRLSTRKRKIYYLTYTLIFMASLAEWMGVYINGKTFVPAFYLRMLKCIDYTLTPIAGAALIGQMRHKTIWSKLVNIVIVFNTVFQIISFFTGWMTKINGQNEYSHGSLYIVYVACYLVVLILVIFQFLDYGKNFRKQNRLSIYMIMVFMVVGIGLQESLGKDVRTAYVAMTFGAILMFIHGSEFMQQRRDEEILEQRIQIKTDALTGLLSRYAYSKKLDDYDNEPDKKPMPEELAAFSIDINGLKIVNDTLGHEAGDELIRGAANCIENVFDDVGSCYRTGGDEFIVLAELSKKEAEECVNDIRKLTKNWKGKDVDKLSLSVGYALLEEHKGHSCSELIKEADKLMYQAKDEYYKKSGLNRRTI
ncbi:MAG: GGDEF domain-containing protein [Eubacterium sp.]|nr:GGDEF domain-containing protein [Eubacterium sp.]